MPRALHDLPEERAGRLSPRAAARRAVRCRSAATRRGVAAALWWWQPAVWWMLARLRLARELHVDPRRRSAATVRARAYVDALMWCSTRRPTLSLSPHGGGRPSRARASGGRCCAGGEMSRCVGRSTMARCRVGLRHEWPASWPGLRRCVRREADRVTAEHCRLASRPLSAWPCGRRSMHPAPRRTVQSTPVWTPASSGYRFRAHVVIDANGPGSRGATGQASQRPAFQRRATRLPRRSARRSRGRPAVAVRAARSGADAARGDPRRDTRDDGSSKADRPCRGRQARRRSASAAPSPARKVPDVRARSPAESPRLPGSGVVIIEATIDTEGAVQEARVFRERPDAGPSRARRRAAVALHADVAERRAVPVILTVTVNFTLRSRSPTTAS